MEKIKPKKTIKPAFFIDPILGEKGDLKTTKTNLVVKKLEENMKMRKAGLKERLQEQIKNAQKD